MSRNHALYDAILEGSEPDAVAAVEAALSDGAEPMALINESMIPAMDEVGRLYEAGEYYVPELMIAGMAMQSATERLRPLLAASGAQPAGRVLVGTVHGDIHDIGKNLVITMLQGGGYEVIDVGVDVPPETFAELVNQHTPDVVGLSALLTVTMPALETAVQHIRAARPETRIIVGGAPINQEFADQIGADGYAESAAGAVPLCRKLLAAS